MNAFHTPIRRARMMAGAACFVAMALLPGCRKAPPPAPPKATPPAAAKTSAAAPAPTNDLTAYLSVFDDLPPQQGKDPFYPTSHRREPAAPIAVAAQAHVESTLVLKGIVGSVGRRIAVINNETMQQGEEASIRTPAGHVRVKCLEIGEDSVLVQVDGEPQPKKLVMQQKK